MFFFNYDVSEMENKLKPSRDDYNPYLRFVTGIKANHNNSFRWLEH